MGCSGNCEGCPNANSCTPSVMRAEDIEDLKKRAEKAEALVRDLKSQLPKSNDKPTKYKTLNGTPIRYRSQGWFHNPDDPTMTALYMERYLNFGITREELQAGKPVIGIAQSGSDISPCNRHHLTLAQRVREGIRSAGGVAFEFPTHPIQETGKRPTATIDRNLAYLSLVEILHGYPIDAVVLLTGCDKTTPACLMAAATVNIPAIVMNVGPMLNGYWGDSLAGSGTAVWNGRREMSTGKISVDEFMDVVASSTPSIGHCNTMGTASTMNAMAEALGMALPGSAAIPAAYRARTQMAYETGVRIVRLTEEDIKPSDILTREAFENAIALNTAIGGSTNAPIHLNAVAKHIGVELNNDVWEKVGYHLPLLVDVQPAGKWLCEEYYRAGGLPAVTVELIENNTLPHPDILTVNGSSVRVNVSGKKSKNPDVIRPFNKPLVADAGFLHLKGNLFDSAIMKTSVIDKDFADRFLSNPKDPNAFEGPVAVFDGPEHYHHEIDNIPDLTEKHILIMRGAGPIGYPGAAEVVNMQPSATLLKKGVNMLPCIGDGRQSGTSGSPSILNASPEAAYGSRPNKSKDDPPSLASLAVLQNGDILRVDLNARTCTILNLSNEDILKRHQELDKKGGYPIPPSQTPWQHIYRENVGSLSEGMVFDSAVQYQRIAQTGIPRNNH